MSGSQFDIPSLPVSADRGSAEHSVPPPPARPDDPRDELALPEQLTRSRNNRRRWLVIFGVLALLAGAYFVFWSDPGPRNQYRVSPVEVRSIRQTVEAFGSLDVPSRVYVPTPRPGQLVEIFVQRGASVEAGQPLARLNATLATAEVTASETALSASMARVDRARAARKNATEERARAERLLERGLVSANSVATARANEQQAIAELRAAEAQRDLDQQAMSGAQLRRDETTLRAPVAGFVLSAVEDVGGMVSPETGPLFVITPPLTELELTVPISEADIGLVRVGQSAVFSVSAYPERYFPAKIGEIESEPQRTGNAVSYRVRLHVDNPDGVLLPGMTANVTLEIAEAREALAVREAALRFNPAGADAPPPDASRSRVWRQLPDGTLQAVEVSAGISDGAYTAVEPASGHELSPGDLVAVGYSGSPREAPRGGPGISLGNK